MSRRNSATELFPFCKHPNRVPYDAYYTGVICNSQGESSRSGYKAVKRLWPDLVSRLLEEQNGKEDDDAPGW